MRFWDGSAWAAPQTTVPLPPAATPAAVATYSQAPVPVYGVTPPPPMTQLPVTPAKPTDGFAVTSLILGCCIFIFCLLTGIPAIIFGFIALSRIKKSGNAGKGMAIAGIVLGFFAVLLSIGALVFVLVIGAVAKNVGTDANGNFNTDTLKARADALVVGAGITSCQQNGGLPSDQARFDDCMTSSAMGDTSGDSPISGDTIDYWYRSADNSFCVQVTRGTSTGAWDSGANVPTVSTCPESSDGTLPTASTTR